MSNKCLVRNVNLFMCDQKILTFILIFFFGCGFGFFCYGLWREFFILKFVIFSNWFKTSTKSNTLSINTKH